MSEKNAPYLVYTDDKDFVLNKEDINSGGGSGNSNVIVIEGIATGTNIEMQASYNDLYEHFNNGKICFLHTVDDQFSTYCMMLISAIEYSQDYRAVVIWPIIGDTALNSEFKANNATDKLVLSMGG